jgi:thioredoxin-dependent peroxiredoxin
LRDKATELADADCRVFGASFDTPEENKAFHDAQEFPFPLLSDVDHAVGSVYGVTRAPDHPYANYPERISYLIDPSGAIAKSYAVTDIATHAADVLADLKMLQT